MKGELEIGFINYSRKNDGVALASKIYYDTLVSCNFSLRWYQVYDYFQPDQFMNFGDRLSSSRFPVATLRPGYDRIVYARKIRKSIRSDLLFLSDPSLINFVKGKKFMVKVHDLIPLSVFSEDLFSKLMMKYSMRRLNEADALIVTTNFMLNEIKSLYGKDLRIFVVPDPVNLPLDTNHIEKFTERKSRKINVLYVAADRPYKNLRTFMDLAKFFEDQHYNSYEFTIVSRLSKTNRSYLDKLSLKNLKVLSNVNSMDDIYRSADIYLHLSNIEGFGRPIVEAMSQGIPVLTLRKEPYSEIVGDNRLMFDQLDLKEIAGIIFGITDETQYSYFSEYCLNRFESKFSFNIFRKNLVYAFEYFMNKVV